jgi:putative transcriptional regulator
VNTGDNGGDADGAGPERGTPGSVVIRLDEVRAARGMTLTELADRVGITVVNLSVLKNGRARAIRFSTLAGLCAALDCQPGDLLGYVPAGRPQDRSGVGGQQGEGIVMQRPDRPEVALVQGQQPRGAVSGRQHHQ